MSTKDFHLILCLAGKGKRFIEKGILMPKFLLTDSSGKKSILELILENLIISGMSKFLLVLNSNHKSFESQILLMTKKFRGATIRYVFIDDTEGQAETAYLGIKYLQKVYENDMNFPIGFHNGDTILLNRNINLILHYLEIEGVLGIIDTFNSENAAYSYIRTDDNQNIISIKEKKVISNMATTGLYIFKSPSTYLMYYKKLPRNHLEKFISGVYAEIISENGILKNINNHKDHTLILGTPEEYAQWINS